MSSVDDDTNSIQEQDRAQSQEQEISGMFDDNQEEEGEKGEASTGTGTANDAVLKNAIANIFGDSDSDLDDLGEVMII